MSPLVTEGEPRLPQGPRAGDRLPDARVLHQGRTAYLQQHLASPHLHFVLCGPVAAWDPRQIADLLRRFPDLLAITYLSRDPSEQALVDPEGHALRQLGVEHAAQYVVRPDGHVGFRCGETDLRGAAEYLDRWFT